MSLGFPPKSTEKEKWYSVKYLDEFYCYFKIDMMNGQYKIIGVHVLAEYFHL